MKTDLVLINPRAINDQVPPLGLLALAAYVRSKGHTVAIIDAQAELLSDEETSERLRQHSPLAYGISFMSYQVRKVQSLLDRLKQDSPSAKSIAGGIHSSILPDEVKQMGFDYVVVGEGEVTLNEILNQLKHGSTELINGVWSNGFLPRELIADLDSLPMPAWDLVPVEKYRVSQPGARYRLEPGECLAISTDRGCKFKCVFCCWGKVFGSTCREKSPVKIMEEIQYLVNTYGIHKFFIMDDGILSNKQHVEQLADLIVKANLNITFAADARVSGQGVNLQTLTRLYEAGLRTLDFGVESGSQRILNNIRKGISVQQVKEAHRLAHQAGIETTSAMIVGHLEETWEDVIDSIALFADVETDYINFNPLTPYPTTEVHVKAKKEGWIRDFDWSKYLHDGWYRVMRNRCFDFDEINELCQICTDAVKVMMSWHKHVPKSLRAYYSLLGTSYPLGLKPYGRFLVIRFMQTRNRDYLRQLSGKQLKLNKTRRIMENRENAQLMISVRKHPQKLLTEPNRTRRIRLFLPIVAEYLRDSVQNVFHRLILAFKLWRG